MKKIFIVYTPYQLIATMNIISVDEGDNLIVLVHPNLKSYRNLCYQMKTTKVVYEEKFVRHYGNYSVFVAHLKVFLEILTMRRRGQRIGYLNEFVDELYVPSDEVICRVAFHQLRKKNKDIKLNVYDDGLGTYLGNMFRKNTVLGNLSYRLFLEDNYAAHIRSIYSYQPELVENEPAGGDLCTISCSQEVTDLFRAYCGDKAEIYRDKKVIFLDQGMGNDDTIKACVDVIGKHFGKNDIVFKMHPRIDTEAYPGFTKSKDGLPFEIITMLVDLSKSVLITHSSGGCINPYLMFNQRPNIIMLVNVNNTDGENNKLYRLFNKINNQIGAEYVLMPKTVDEFEKMLLLYK